MRQGERSLVGPCCSMGLFFWFKDPGGGLGVTECAVDRLRVVLFLKSAFFKMMREAQPKKRNDRVEKGISKREEVGRLRGAPSLLSVKREDKWQKKCRLS